MKLTCNMNYLEEFRPPRCRKMRTRISSDCFTADIPETTSCDAPVAFRIHQISNGEDRVAEIRKHGNFLYELMKRPGDPALVDISKPVAGSELHLFLRRYTGNFTSKATAAEVFRRDASIYLIIDGNVWHTTNEPHYLVGYWHGASFGVSTWPAPDNYAYSAFDEQKARDAAVALATANNCSNPEKFKVRNSWIEVIDPTAVTLHQGPAVFAIQKVTVCNVSIKANTYAEALAMAQALPSSAYSAEDITYSFHGTMQESDPHMTAGCAV